MRVLQCLDGVPDTGEQRGWVLPGTWMGAVWGVVCGEVRGNVCVLCGAVFGQDGGCVAGWVGCGVWLRAWRRSGE